jgi:RNA polymerase sigma-70 factor, ECF subfamily
MSFGRAQLSAGLLGGPAQGFSWAGLLMVDERDDTADVPECDTPEKAFEQYFTMVWRGLRRLGVQESALDDAAQDVFLVLHRRWADFAHQSSLRTWIYGILLRVASDHTRRARRERARWSAEVPELESSVEAPDSLYQQREAGQLLRLALSELEENERQMLVLVELEERSVVEAADALGINLNTAYSRLRRARISFEHALRVASESKLRSEGSLEALPPLTESNGE